MSIFKDIFLPCLYSFVASIAFGIQFNIRLRHIFAAGIGGIISQLIFSVMELDGNSMMLCYFVTAAAMSAYAETLARRLHVPVNMYLVISIIPLVPGGYIYNTMITLISGDTDGFLTQFATTLGIAGAIAMGVFAVSSVVRLYRVLTKKNI